MKLLKGHISPETAYLVHNHSAGFGQVCDKRYWIEHRPFFGWRVVTQTSNLRGDGWNKPHAAPYQKHGLALYLADNGSVIGRESTGEGVPVTEVVNDGDSLYTEAEIEQSQRRLEALFGFKPEEE